MSQPTDESPTVTIDLDNLSLEDIEDAPRRAQLIQELRSLSRNNGILLLAHYVENHPLRHMLLSQVLESSEDLFTDYRRGLEHYEATLPDRDE